MPRDVKGGSIQDRILRLLAERYPCSFDEMVLALGVREDTARLEVKRLAAQGLVVTETLGDKQYLTLSGAGFRVVGLAPADAARLRKQGKLPPPPPRDDADPAYM